MNSIISAFLLFLTFSQIHSQGFLEASSPSFQENQISVNLNEKEQKWNVNIPYSVELTMETIPSENNVVIELTFENSSDYRSHSFLKLPEKSGYSHGHYVFMIPNIDKNTQRLAVSSEFLKEFSKAEIILPEKKSKIMLDFEVPMTRHNLRFLQREEREPETNTINSPVGLIVAVGFGALILIFIFILAVVKNGRTTPVPRRPVAPAGRTAGTNVQDMAIVEQAQIEIQNIRAAHQKKNFSLAEIEGYFPPTTYSEIHLDFEQNSCPICLDAYKPDSTCRQMICSHVFHADCIKAWLLKHDKCPLCMTTINNETVQDYIRTKNTLAALPGDEILDEESPKNNHSYVARREIFI